MADNGVQELEQAASEVEKAPPSERKPVRPDEGAAAAEGPTVPNSGDEGDSLVRSVYVARSTAFEVTSAGDFSHMETTDAGLLVRGAFLARLSEGQSEAAGDHDRLGEDMLRAAYVKRLTAEPVPAKRAAPARKAAAKKQPARSTRAKAKPARRAKARGKQRRR